MANGTSPAVAWIPFPQPLIVHRDDAKSADAPCAVLHPCIAAATVAVGLRMGYGSERGTLRVRSRGA